MGEDLAALTVVDGVVLARLVAVYRDVLRAHQEELNRLNVYPVPDGDTGTNMALTVESVCAEIGDATEMEAVCQAIAHGSLMGARGNSGVILSQILRGFTDTIRGAHEVGAAEFAQGLQAASDAATAAVMHPVDGTILTVARDSAAAAELALRETTSLVALVEAVDCEAHASVDRTPDLLPVLARAGVVDAGGHGLSLWFDAWLHVLDGRALPDAPASSGSVPTIVATSDHAVVDGPRYEVMFYLRAPDESIPQFRDAWDALGDSIVVVGGDGLWNCHVHTNDIGAAVEAGIAAGRPVQIHVTDLHEQVGRLEADWVVQGEAVPASATGVVAVASGAGITNLLRGLGVAVVGGGQSMNPSTQQILDAVEHVRAEHVLVLPNNKNIVAVAEQAAAHSDRAVTVIPTQSVVEALVAMLEFDRDGPGAENAELMRNAAARVRTGEVTQAVRDSEVVAGDVAAGDWIGVTREGVIAVAPSPSEATIELLAKLIVETDELVTVLVGADANPDEVAAVRAYVGSAHPHVELEVHEGGQPLYPFILGVE